MTRGWKNSLTNLVRCSCGGADWSASSMTAKGLTEEAEAAAAAADEEAGTADEAPEEEAEAAVGEEAGEAEARSLWPLVAGCSSNEKEASLDSGFRSPESACVVTAALLCCSLPLSATSPASGPTPATAGLGAGGRGGAGGAGFAGRSMEKS